MWVWEFSLDVKLLRELWNGLIFSHLSQSNIGVGLDDVLSWPDKLFVLSLSVVADNAVDDNTDEEANDDSD